MPSAREYKCRVTELLWVTPTVMRIRFEPDRGFKFQPGQFLSVQVPQIDFMGKKLGKPVKRAYSFSSSPEEAADGIYELCVKHVKGGVGTEYLAKLKKGDVFKACAPYGDFEYVLPQNDRNVCFIATGTGIAPFKSVVASRRYIDNRPARALLLFGAPNLQEVIYQKVFEDAGVQVVNALDHENDAGEYFKGRVTDYLKSLPADWEWHSTDFYLCGNGRMVADVKRFLVGSHAVPEKSIHMESFAPAPVIQHAPLPMPVSGLQRKLAVPPPAPAKARNVA